MYKTFEMELAGRPLKVDVGRVAKQANGAVLMHYGDTTLYSNCFREAKRRNRFLPTERGIQRKNVCSRKDSWRIQ